ncbi:hypothetical protein DFH09DRAFT_1295854 [Mycena vulgaris]|nr:hypothetical protein DFH09DRAFT_1295854 [Mycena vulgaris]
MCKVAEGGAFSLAMLADTVILFRDLSRIYRREFSSPFLWLLCAYVYISEQNTSSDMGTPLRIFLEHPSGSPPPVQDISSKSTRYISGFDAFGGVIEDAIRAFHARPSHATIPVLIRNIFVAHFDQAIVVLQNLVAVSCSALPIDSFTLAWALYSIVNILPFLSDPRRLVMLEIMSMIIRHFGESSRGSRGHQDWLCKSILPCSCSELWLAGLLEEALAASEQVIKYLRSASTTDVVDDPVAADCRRFQLRRSFVLYDMRRIPDAVEIIKTHPHPIEVGGERDVDYLLPLLIQMRILRRTGREQEAFQMLRRLISDVAGSRKHWADYDGVFDLHLHILFAELAAAWGRVGQPDNAVRTAERAVATCRHLVDDEDVEHQQHALVHSLTIFSDCLAAVGKNDRAFEAAKEATSIYAANAPQLWRGFLFTIRGGRLVEALNHLARYLSEKGDLDGATAATFECAEAQKKILDLPMGFLFSQIENPIHEPEDILETTVFLTRADREFAIPTTPPFETRLARISQDSELSSLSERETACAALSIAAAKTKPVTVVDNSIAANAGKDAAEDGIRSKDNILTPPLVKLKFCNTSMDILWWMFLGILSTAFAVVCNWK